MDKRKNQGGTTSAVGEDIVLPNVAPDWDYYKHGFNQQNREFLYTPTNRDMKFGDPGAIRLLISRDSVGNFVGRYVIYAPDVAYRQQTNGQYSATTFKGNVVYTDITGKFLNGYHIDSGRITAPLQIKRNGTATLRECYDLTITIFVEEIALKASVNNFQNPVRTTYTYCFRGDIGGGGSGEGGGNGGGEGGSTTTWGGSQPTNMFDANFETSAAYRYLKQMGFSDAQLQFIASDANGQNIYGQIRQYLGQNPSAAKKANARLQTDFLSSNSAYYAANVAAGFLATTIADLEKYLSNGFTGQEFAALFVSGHLHSSDPFISYVITKWWFSKTSIQREQFKQGFSDRAGETYDGFTGTVNFYKKFATTMVTKGRFCFGGNCGNDLPKIPYLDSDIFSSFLGQYKDMIQGAKNGDSYAQGQLVFEAAMLFVPFDEISLTTQVSSHVFRGTSIGYQGSRQMIEAGVTSVAIDPLAATVFAIESSNFGVGVLHIVPVNTLESSGVKIMEGNWLKEVEREVTLSILPTETASAAEISISHTRARQILRDMGFNLPSQITKNEITETLRQLPRMTEAQIQEFIRRSR